MIQVNKDRLQTFFERIIDFLPNEVTIQEDSYFLIGSDEWTSFSKDVTPDVGSLNDDWYFLNQIILEGRDVSSSDLDRLSSILRAISQEINPI